MKFNSNFSSNQVFFDGSPPVEEYPHRSFGSTVPLSSTPYQMSTATIPAMDQVDSDNNAQHPYVASSHRMRKEK